MAGDWIKTRCSLRKTTQVKGIAATLKLSPYEVVGRLIDVWGLGDAYAVARDSLSRFCPDGTGTNVPDIEGFLSHYTRADIDSEAGRDGFADAMASQGWLDVYDDGIGFPEWDQHHSKSAKTRACEQKKKRDQRRMSQKTGDICPDVDGKKSGLEKRREDNSNTPKSPPGTLEPSFESFRKIWNQTPGVRTCSKETPARLKSFRARCKEPDWRDEAKQVLKKFPLKCTEGEPEGWRPEIDWFLRPGQVTKILEGKFDWTKENTKPVFKDQQEVLPIITTENARDFR